MSKFECYINPLPMKTISLKKGLVMLAVIALGLGTSCKEKDGNGNEETEMSRDTNDNEGQDLGTQPDSVTLDTIKNDTEY